LRLGQRPRRDDAGDGALDQAVPGLGDLVADRDAVPLAQQFS
jgi:hypothetical protein